MSLSFSSYRLFAVFDKFLKYSLIVLPLFSQNKQRILLLNVTTKNNMACNVFLPYIRWCLDLPERPELPERLPKYRKDQRIIGN